MSPFPRYRCLPFPISLSQLTRSCMNQRSNSPYAGRPTYSFVLLRNSPLEPFVRFFVTLHISCHLLAYTTHPLLIHRLPYTFSSTHFLYCILATVYSLPCTNPLPPYFTFHISPTADASSTKPLLYFDRCPSQRRCTTRSHIRRSSNASTSVPRERS